MGFSFGLGGGSMRTLHIADWLEIGFRSMGIRKGTQAGVCACRKDDAIMLCIVKYLYGHDHHEHSSQTAFYPVCTYVSYVRGKGLPPQVSIA